MKLLNYFLLAGRLICQQLMQKLISSYSLFCAEDFKLLVPADDSFDFILTFKFSQSLAIPKGS